ncbi:MAG: hypothetical protein PHI75_02020 [Bacilli bacterium]|jgi:hypothetical protein|nr:hypothetical protein [Bacilli bacterium]MDD3841477.1 hypothetical protein [Bacilli bacterium]HKM10411.1 hypothetical protein [Bacilli bacterium]
MKKNQREIECLFELFKEEREIEKIVEELPRGYISVKVISGHTYNYRQWREGDKIISEYVPEAFVNSIKRKIAIRKENESALKEVRKELQSKARFVIKKEILSEEEVSELREKARV